MPKAFLLRKKLAAKDFLNQSTWSSNNIYSPDTPPPSPEEELNNAVNQARRAQSQLVQLYSNGLIEQPIAGPSGILPLNSHHSSGELFFLIIKKFFQKSFFKKNCSCCCLVFYIVSELFHLVVFENFLERRSQWIVRKTFFRMNFFYSPRNSANYF